MIGARTRAAAETLEAILARGRFRGPLRLLGPGFVAAIAYVDPGNFATNVSAGARFGYALVWVIVAANLMAVLVQYLSSKLGLITGRSLPEVCRDRYPVRSAGSCGPRRSSSRSRPTSPSSSARRSPCASCSAGRRSSPRS